MIAKEASREKKDNFGKQYCQFERNLGLEIWRRQLGVKGVVRSDRKSVV